MQSTICNYVSNHHDVTNDENRNNFKTGHSVTSKRRLKVLKSRIPKPEEEFKYFGRILRKKYRKKKISENYDHPSEYTKIFGITAKKF